MNNIWTITLYGLLAGTVGTAAGGAAACFLPRRDRRVIRLILEYSAGLMLAVVCFDLLPGAFRLASFSIVLAGLLIGAGLMLPAELLMTRGGEKRGASNTGLVIALGLALHNFPEGLAVGSGFQAEPRLGLALAAAIMLHDVPEGLAVAAPLRAAGTSRIKAFALTLATGIPMALGAWLGAWAGHASARWLAPCLALAGGAMLYVVFADMLPESRRLSDTGRINPVGCLLGMLTGVLLFLRLGG